MKRIILASLFMATISGLTFANTNCPEGTQDSVNDTAKTDSAPAADKSTASDDTYDARASQAPKVNE